MARALILNDTHFGVERGTGTTPQSAQALRKWQHEMHSKIINSPQFSDAHLIYNGDVFDKFQVPLSDAAELVHTWDLWLKEHPTQHIIAGFGNHDISKDSSKTSILNFVCATMLKLHPNRFFARPAAAWLYPNVLMVPHAESQTAFEGGLKFVYRECVRDDGHLIILVHANYAVPSEFKSDHSLNFSKEMADSFSARGCRIIFGHIHDFVGNAYDPNVMIPGNQIPTSVGDFLKCPDKYMVTIENMTQTGGHRDGERPEIVLHKLYEDAPIFRDVEYANLDAMTADLSGIKFLRIHGEIPREELPAAMDRVAKLRAKTPDVFVIGTKFTVAGTNGAEELAVSGDELRSVDVLEYVFDNVEEEQRTVLKSLLGKING